MLYKQGLHFTIQQKLSFFSQLVLLQLFLFAEWQLKKEDSYFWASYKNFFLLGFKIHKNWNN